MNIQLRKLTGAFLLLLPMLGTLPVEAQSPMLQLMLSSKRIVVLGDSITYNGQYLATIETWLISQQPVGELPIFINMGLPSETVSGLSEPGHAGGRFPRPNLHERLDRVLEKLEPDLVIACYGMNCGIYEPLDDSRFNKFQHGIQLLVDKIAQSGGNLILLTPPTYDGKKDNRNFSYDNVLEHYSQWMVKKGRADGWNVIDLHKAMDKELQAKRTKNPKFTFQPDGVHPNTQGHQTMANLLIRTFDPDFEPNEFFQATANKVHKRQIVLRDAWLTATGHERPGLASGLPIVEAIELARQQFDLAEVTTEFLDKLNEAND